MKKKKGYKLISVIFNQWTNLEKWKDIIEEYKENNFGYISIIATSSLSKMSY